MALEPARDHGMLRKSAQRRRQNRKREGRQAQGTVEQPPEDDQKQRHDADKKRDTGQRAADPAHDVAEEISEGNVGDGVRNAAQNAPDEKPAPLHPRHCGGEWNEARDRPEKPTDDQRGAAPLLEESHGPGERRRTLEAPPSGQPVHRQTARPVAQLGPQKGADRHEPDKVEDIEQATLRKDAAGIDHQRSRHDDAGEKEGFEPRGKPDQPVAKTAECLERRKDLVERPGHPITRTLRLRRAARR